MDWWSGVERQSWLFCNMLNKLWDPAPINQSANCACWLQPVMNTVQYYTVYEYSENTWSGEKLPAAALPAC